MLSQNKASLVSKDLSCLEVDDYSVGRKKSFMNIIDEESDNSNPVLLVQQNKVQLKNIQMQQKQIRMLEQSHYHEKLRQAKHKQGGSI